MNLTSCTKHVIGDRSGWLLQFRYDKQITERIKREVPARHRQWNPKQKAWWVYQMYEDVLDEIFDNFEILAEPQGMIF